MWSGVKRIPPSVSPSGLIKGFHHHHIATDSRTDGRIRERGTHTHTHTPSPFPLPPLYAFIHLYLYLEKTQFFWVERGFCLHPSAPMSFSADGVGRMMYER